MGLVDNDEKIIGKIINKGVGRLAMQKAM